MQSYSQQPSRTQTPYVCQSRSVTCQWCRILSVRGVSAHSFMLSALLGEPPNPRQRTTSQDGAFRERGGRPSLQCLLFPRTVTVPLVLEHQSVAETSSYQKLPSPPPPDTPPDYSDLAYSHMRQARMTPIVEVTGAGNDEVAEKTGAVNLSTVSTRLPCHTLPSVSPQSSALSRRRLFLVFFSG